MTHLRPPVSTLLSPGGPTVTLGPTGPGDAGRRRAKAARVHRALLRRRRRPAFPRDPSPRLRRGPGNGPRSLRGEHQRGGLGRPPRVRSVSRCVAKGGHQAACRSSPGDVTAADPARQPEGQPRRHLSAPAWPRTPGPRFPPGLGRATCCLRVRLLRALPAAARCSSSRRDVESEIQRPPGVTSSRRLPKPPGTFPVTSPALLFGIHQKSEP